MADGIGSPSAPDPADRSRYELMRAKHVTIPASATRKARWCGYLLAVAALTAPIIATLPATVRETRFEGDPLATPLGAAAVVLIGVASLILAGIGLAALAAYTTRNPNPPESRVWLLIGLEDAFSGFGFITGFLGVTAGVGILASGHAGPERLAWLTENGVDPYLAFASVPATPTVTSAVALVGAIAVFAASAVGSRG